MQLEELSLRQELWIDSEPTGSLRATMLLNLIQRSKELVRTVTTMPASEIAQMTITTNARLCAALSCIPTAVVTLIELVVGKSLSGPPSSASQSEAQAIYDATDYPNLVMELVKALETRTEGLSDAEKETDIAGSICSKVKLLARCYPYRVRTIVDIGLLKDDPRQDTSMSTVEANAGHAEAVANPQQSWSFAYSGLDDDVFHFSDEQWTSVMSDFGNFNY